MHLKALFGEVAMPSTVMREFLSEDNLNLHLRHMRNEANKYSILEKSIKGLHGCSVRDIPHLRIGAKERDEAVNLLCYIESHRSYFDSFAILKKKCSNIRRYFGSEEKLLYEIYEQTRAEKGGFLYVYIERNHPKIKVMDPVAAYVGYFPILALDLDEHAYFLDYAFDKQRYLRSAISYLNLEKVDKALTLS